MDTTEKFDFEEFKKQAIQGMYEGKPFGGEKGVIAPLLKHFLESALSGELDAHLHESKAQGIDNRRNGKASKGVKSLSGEFVLESGRDRNGTFEPMILPKRQVIINDALEEKIIGLYGMGMSTRDISAYIKEMYLMDVSAAQLSAITDKVIPAMQEWRSRALEAIYPVVFMDCIHYKVKEDGRVVARAIYNLLGIDVEGRKDLIGMYSAESEGAKFWLSVLTDLKNRGVKDILIACVDGLKGFPEAIASIFPHTQVQLCIVHQIRNSLKYISHKDKKDFVADLKLVYNAISKEEGYRQLELLETRWGTKYGIAIQSWFRNWENLSSFYGYDTEIRKLIYTTNPIEGFHRQVRKVTKTKGAFTSDTALLKLVYLVVQRIQEKWTIPVRNWGQTMTQLHIIFGDRLEIGKFDR